MRHSQLQNQPPSFSERFKYWFDNTMSKGSSSLVIWLALLSIIVIFVFGLILFTTGISPEGEALDLPESMWQSAMAALDPGAVGGDSGWAYRGVRFAVTIGGIFIVATLIGVINSGIEALLEELKKGRSKVIEQNHSVIVGWSNKIYQIVEQLAQANSNVKNAKIVIFADKDVTWMKDQIDQHQLNLMSSKLIFRSGKPLSSMELSVANIDSARSVIILADEHEHADTLVIRTVLSITNNPKRKAQPYRIVSELQNAEQLEAAKLAGGPETKYVVKNDLIARLTAQTCRQSGLSILYSDLLKFEGDEIYTQELAELVGQTYGQALFAFESCAVIGIYYADGTVAINPPHDTVIRAQDQMIVIAEDDDTIHLSGDFKKEQVNSSLIVQTRPTPLVAEKTLMLGWNAKARKLILELDILVQTGSSLRIVTAFESVQHDVEELTQKLKNLSIELVTGSINQKAVIQAAQPELFDQIIVLSDYLVDDQQTEIDPQGIDAKTLVALLHLRQMADRQGRDFSIVSEMMDIQNQELAHVAKADDFVVGENLASLMLAQLSENPKLSGIFDVLFSSQGSEIYFNSANDYIKDQSQCDFYTIVQAALQKGHTAIGYRLASLTQSAEDNFGIVLNPNKKDLVRLGADDKIIVLAEDNRS